MNVISKIYQNAMAICISALYLNVNNKQLLINYVVKWNYHELYAIFV